MGYKALRNRGPYSCHGNHTAFPDSCQASPPSQASHCQAQVLVHAYISVAGIALSTLLYGRAQAISSSAPL